MARNGSRIPQVEAMQGLSGALYGIVSLFKPT